jgi:Leucine-rich repeat (LRR) protein
MKTLLIINILLAYIFQLTSSIGIDQSLLIENYGFDIDSTEIDLSRKSIDSIDINTFKGFTKLEKLFLDDNKIKQLEYGLFNHLSNLKEIWLESNSIVTVDKNVFVGLNKLEKVCITDNPISLAFPNSIKPLCDTNPNCKINVNEKCFKDIQSIYIFLNIININFIKYIFFNNLSYYTRK